MGSHIHEVWGNSVGWWWIVSQQMCGLLLRETQISATDISVNVRTSCPLGLEISQNPHLGFLLYTFQIISLCSPGFSSQNAQSIAAILLCSLCSVLWLSPFLQLLLLKQLNPQHYLTPSKIASLLSPLPIATSSPSFSLWNHCQRVAKARAASLTSCSANMQAICTSPSLALPIPQHMIALFH